MDIEETVKLRKRKCGELGIEHDTCIVGTKELDDLLKKLDKKDEIIIAMAEQLTTPVHGIDWVIDYFTKKVTKED